MTYALITGASKGLGKSIAEELAKRNYNLLLVARSSNLLDDLSKSLKAKHKVEVQYLECDLSAPNSSKIIKEWTDHLGANISILVNNAGYGLWGNFETLKLQGQLNMMQLNMQSIVELTYTYLPQLKLNKNSYILNVGSTAGYQAVPTLAVYSASKAFVIAFTRGLAYELKNTNVSVTCLSPGSTDTGFMDRAGMNDKIKATAEKFNMTPELVAKIGVKGLFNKKTEVIPGLVNLLTVHLTYHLPKSLIEKVAANIYLKALK